MSAVRACAGLFGLGFFVLTTACGEGVPASRGLHDPVRVEGAQFFPEPLPGGTEPVEEGPVVTSISLPGRILVHRASELSLTGLVSEDAVAIGVGFPTLDGGHWVFPSGGLDPQDLSERSFAATVSLGPAVPPGVHPLRVVAIDAEGRVGRQRRLEVCVQPDIPDNGHSCSRSRPLPEVVAVLQWDADVDVDLIVVTPDGITATPRRPLTQPLPRDESGNVLPPSDPAYADIPRISRDSLRNCTPDGMRLEHLMFLERPSGQWQFRARLSNSCGVPTVRYRFSIYEPREDEDDPNGEATGLIETQARIGRFIAAYDTATTGLGDLVLDIDFD